MFEVPVSSGGRPLVVLALAHGDGVKNDLAKVFVVTRLKGEPDLWGVYDFWHLAVIGDDGDVANGHGFDKAEPKCFVAVAAIDREFCLSEKVGDVGGIGPTGKFDRRVGFCDLFNGLFQWAGSEHKEFPSGGHRVDPRFDDDFGAFFVGEPAKKDNGVFSGERFIAGVNGRVAFDVDL